MAGLPWIFTFLLIALISLRRGWMWLAVLSLFCMGAVAGGTEIGSGVVGATQTLIATVWTGLVGLLNSVAA